jgi:lysine biosynthesis protein LysW
MTIEVPCPGCGATKELPEDAAPGARRWCRDCGAVLELVALQPPAAKSVPRCAEDFGI